MEPLANSSTHGANRLSACKIRINRILRLPITVKIMLLETYILMGLARLCILVIPFRRIASLMGRMNQESSECIAAEDAARVKQISWCIYVMSRHTFWESKCLVQALAAQVMLKRRLISNTLYMGVARNESNKLIAHAWLRSGQLIVTGGEVKDEFKVVAKFSNIPGIKNA